jgi:hypothetical protein
VVERSSETSKPLTTTGCTNAKKDHHLLNHHHLIDVIGKVRRCNAERYICTSSPFGCFTKTTAIWHNCYQLIATPHTHTSSVKAVVVACLSICLSTFWPSICRTARKHRDKPTYSVSQKPLYFLTDLLTPRRGHNAEANSSPASQINLPHFMDTKFITAFTTVGYLSLFWAT